MHCDFCAINCTSFLIKTNAGLRNKFLKHKCMLIMEIYTISKNRGQLRAMSCDAFLECISNWPKDIR